MTNITALATRDESSLEKPKAVIEAASEVAKQLKDVVNQAGLAVKIGNGHHLKIEGWETVGRLTDRATVRTFDATFIEIDGAKGFRARSEVISRDGVVIGGAEALCLNTEANWENKPWYALASMAQTRAAGKALRNIYSWVIVLAGYESTPAEEMDGVNAKRTARPKSVAVPAVPDHPKCKKCGGDTRLVPAGKTKSGTDYPAFWGCLDRNCKGGSTKAAEWDSERQRLMEDAMERASIIDTDQVSDGGDIPF